MFGSFPERNRLKSQPILVNLENVRRSFLMMCHSFSFPSHGSIDADYVHTCTLSEPTTIEPKSLNTCRLGTAMLDVRYRTQRNTPVRDALMGVREQQGKNQ